MSSKGKKKSASKKSAGSAKKKAGSRSGSAPESSGAPSAGGALPLNPDGTPNLEAMSKEELVERLKKIKEENDSEKQERNYFQLERDKINTFWEITKSELTDAKSELRNKDREIEELEEHHQVEIKVYKQKVKHLLYEHQNIVTQLKADGESSLKLEQEEHHLHEHELKRDKRSLKLELKEFELSHEELVKNLKLEHDRDISRLRSNFERAARDLHAKYEKKMKLTRDDLELRRKNEIHEIEERKNGQINALMKNHEKAFAEIKNYYNDITLNNLALINSLKEQVEEMKKKEERNEKLMTEITAENKRLSEPLHKALEEGESLRRELANYEKDKASLQAAKARLRVIEEKEKNLQWEHEVLIQRFEQVQKERDELYEKFVSTIYDVQQKTGLKNLILEKKLETLTESLEKKELQLNEILQAAHLDPSALSTVSRKLEEVLDTKNAAIKELQYELARITKAHNDVIRVYESKMTEFGIPVEELGFKPFLTKTGVGPAGLVAVQ